MYGELVKRLRNRRISIQQLGTLNDYPLLVEAADAIEELSKSRWISAEEMLPKDLQNVLVIDDGRVTIGHCEHYYCDEQICVEWHDTLYYPIDPPYWQPLPEPPKEGEA